MARGQNFAAEGRPYKTPLTDDDAEPQLTGGGLDDPLPSNAPTPRSAVAPTTSSFPAVPTDPDEFCGVPRRQAYLLIALTVLIVAVVAATVGVFVSNNGSDESSNVPIRTDFELEPDVIVQTSQQKLNLIRKTFEAYPILRSHMEQLPSESATLTKEVLDDETADPFLRAASWMILENGLNYEQAIVPRFALVAFYFAQGGPNWTTRTSWLSPDINHCEWYGVRCCTGIHREMVFSCKSFSEYSVVEIDMEENNMTGKINNALVLLQSLNALVLRRNSLTGVIPADTVAAMPSLRILSLQRNRLSGPIPDNLRDNGALDTLQIHGNAFTGEFPLSYCPGRATIFRYLTLDCSVNACDPSCCYVENCIDAVYE